MEISIDSFLGRTYPIIRETIAYKTGAADGLKDILIITRTHLAIITISQLSYLPNPFDENGELIVPLFEDFKSSFPKFIVRLEDIIRAELSPNKSSGHFLLGNKRYGYELKLDARLPSGIRQIVAVTVYENGSQNVLAALENLLSERLCESVVSFTIPAKPRISLFKKYSGIILFFTYIWPIYRIYRHIIFRTSSKISKYPTPQKVSGVKEDASHKRPFTNIYLGWLLKTIGTILFVVNLTGLPIIIGFCALFFDFTTVSKLKMWGLLSSVISMYIFPNILSPLLIYLGYRLSLRPLSGGTKNGRNILFLRAFDEDGRNTFFRDPVSSLLLSLDVPYWGKWLYRGWFGWAANYHPFRNIRMIFSICRDSAEEQLAAFFKQYGQVIAIGKPGEVLRQGGAVRMYVSHEGWQAEVKQLIDNADLVIIQPAETHGIWWELRTLFSNKPKQNILISLVNFRHTPERYERFKYIFEQEFGAILSKPLPPKMVDEHFLYIDSTGTPIVLPSYYHSPFAWPRLGYDFNFKKSLFPFLYNQPVNRTKVVESTSRISWMSVIGSFTIWMMAFLGIWVIVRLILGDVVLYPEVTDETSEPMPFSREEVYPAMVVLTGKLAQAGRIYHFNRNDTLWPKVVKDLPLTKEFLSSDERAAFRVEVRPSHENAGGRLDSSITLIRRYAERQNFEATLQFQDTGKYEGRIWYYHYLKATLPDTAKWVGRGIWIYSSGRMSVLIDCRIPKELANDSAWDKVILPSLQQFSIVADSTRQ